jgi:hypothetical protein
MLSFKELKLHSTEEEKKREGANSCQEKRV